MQRDYLTWREKEARKHGMILGAWLGTTLGLLVAGLISVALDTWRVAQHDRLTREAVAAVDARLAACRTLVERVSGQPYEATEQLAAEIDRVRGGAR